MYWAKKSLFLSVSTEKKIVLFQSVLSLGSFLSKCVATEHCIFCDKDYKDFLKYQINFIIAIIILEDFEKKFFLDFRYS